MRGRSGPRVAVAALLRLGTLSAVRQEDDKESTQEALLQQEALELRYLPGVHARAAAQAFDAVAAEWEPMKRLLDAYNREGMLKTTSFSCRGDGCEGLGPTDCLGGQCLCRDGYGFEGGKCVPRYSRPLFQKSTGAKCDQQKPCARALGPTVCSNETNSCICQRGYAFKEGRCLGASKIRAHLAEGAVKAMLLAGVREPDEMPCPGDTLEEGSMGDALRKMIANGEPRFQVSMCRTGVQVYHASALPLVKRDDLRQPPLENGGNLTDNAGADLYSVMTNRQWRTQAIKVMSTEFAYAITMPDLSEAAKRLGNLFHTLGDSFSASHVVRESKDGEPSAEVCESLTVKMVMSMDVMNFLVHVQADRISTDLLFNCSVYYTEQTIKLWAQARQQQPANAAAANKWVGKLVKEVLCPSLHMHPETLDMPAGGANAYYSAANSAANLKSLSAALRGRRRHVPTEPRGTISDSEAQHIVGRWNMLLGLEQVTKKDTWRKTASLMDDAVSMFENTRRFPARISLPERSLDACKDPSVADVGEKHVQAARNGQLPPQYLLPHYED